MLKPPLLALLAVAACLAAAAPANAALTGNYAGSASHDLAVLEEPYTNAFVLTVYKGRLTGIAGRLRMECLSGIRDVRLVKGWKTTRGPKIEQGTFAVNVNGVRVSGHLNSSSGAGTISGAKSGCEGDADWNVRKRKI